MKSLMRWGKVIGLVGSVVASSLIMAGSRAMALTTEQVLAHLRTVPVFAITDAQGAPLVASPSGEQQAAPVTAVFISQQDAQSFLEGLRTSQPELGNSVQVVPVSLAEVYQLAVSANGSQDDPLEFTFVPIRTEVSTAITLLQQQDPEVQEFEGVPLFLARSSATDGGYLTVRQGEQQFIPVFFKRDELQAVLQRLSTEQPELASQMTVQVINLENLIETMRTSDDPGLERIQLVPPQESVEFVRRLQAQPGQPAQPSLQQPGQTAQPRPPQSGQPVQR